jgi:hypothetical protein
VQGTPARHVLDVWPPFPLIIKSSRCTKAESVDNIVAALERSDHVDSIRLRRLDDFRFKKISAAMQEEADSSKFHR